MQFARAVTMLTTPRESVWRHALLTHIITLTECSDSVSSDAQPTPMLTWTKLVWLPFLVPQDPQFRILEMTWPTCVWQAVPLVPIRMLIRQQGGVLPSVALLFILTLRLWSAFLTVPLGHHDTTVVMSPRHACWTAQLVNMLITQRVNAQKHVGLWMASPRSVIILREGASLHAHCPKTHLPIRRLDSASPSVLLISFRIMLHSRVLLQLHAQIIPLVTQPQGNAFRL